ncbi:M23 family metallopeptidase [Radicibacter daui]|uniref:M23 family metallopeptidase n=1 Tax=Radicibacter daui TaxID=3064829 RepID=UPI004046CDF0
MRKATILSVAAIAALVTFSVGSIAHASPTSCSTSDSTPFISPVSGGYVSSTFGWRIHPVLGDRRFHNGVDFALPQGSPVYAPAEGVVVQVGTHGNYGRLVRIKHPDGIETTYAHLAGFAKGLKVGAKVSCGDLIAYVGRSGLATGSHLYWEVSENDEFLDPLSMMEGSPEIRVGETKPFKPKALSRNGKPASKTSMVLPAPRKGAAGKPAAVAAAKPAVPVPAAKNAVVAKVAVPSPAPRAASNDVADGVPLPAPRRVS